MRVSETVDEDNTEEWLQSDACELGFQHTADTDIVITAMKEKGVEEGGEDESEEEEKAVSASVIAWHCTVLTVV
jgi:hypothetical protein